MQILCIYWIQSTPTFVFGVIWKFTIQMLNFNNGQLKFSEKALSIYLRMAMTHGDGDDSTEHV